MLVLVSTVLAIAAPSLRNFARGRQTADAAAKVLSLTHSHSRAASWGCVHRLNFDTEAGTYWLTMQEAGTFVEIDSNHGRRFPLPVGVSVVLDLQSDADPPTYIQFYPDGRCDVATIELAGGERDVYHVVCLSASERFKIVSASEGETP